MSLSKEKADIHWLQPIALRHAPDLERILLVWVCRVVENNICLLAIVLPSARKTHAVENKVEIGTEARSSIVNTPSSERLGEYPSAKAASPQGFGGLTHVIAHITRGAIAAVRRCGILASAKVNR
ncbi:MAG TPA: hypothetical protein DIC31_07515 [Rhizobiales bacterium]|nr:hypothetical protein [Hyphomicrobiales bacterium]